MAKERRDAVFHGAAERVVEVMNEPGPSVARTKQAISKGFGVGKSGRASKAAYGPVQAAGGFGRVPVDTGFLRASLVAVKGSNLPPLREPPEGRRSFAFNDGAINLVINSAAITDTITVVYTAKYAKVMEERYAFVRLAAQQWPQIVAAVNREVRAGAT